MLLTVMIIGGLLLAGLAVAVGWTDGSGRGAAWSHIASQRRELWELRRELLAWEQELQELAAQGECTRCRLVPPQHWRPPAA